MIKKITDKSILAKITPSYITIAIVATIMLISTVNVSAQSSDIIRDKDDAATFCTSELPDGRAEKTRYGYCAFTQQGSSPACTVSSSGSFPVFSETCVTYQLDDMVGKSKSQLKSDAAAGGGTSTNPATNTGSTSLNEMLQTVINALSAIIGLAVVGSIILAGIQYTTAGSNASQVSAAKERINMAVLALILFMFGYSILQWLVPGGIF